MELRQVRYVLEVAELLHFGRAADRLTITASALSQQVARLERELGVELFDRSPRRVRLTAAGHAFVEQARDVVAASDRAMAAARAADRAAAERLVVGFTSHGAGDLTTRLLERFAHRRPGATVELTELDFAGHFTALAERRVDAQFVRLPVEFDRDVRVAVLRAEPRVVAVPRHHPLRGRPVPVAAADLETERFFRLPDDVPPSWRRHFAPWGTRPDSPRVRTVGEALGLVGAGEGVVLLPRSLAAALPRGDLAYLEAAVEPSRLAVAWRCGHRTGTAHVGDAPCGLAEAFAATAVEVAGDDVPAIGGGR